MCGASLLSVPASEPERDLLTPGLAQLAAVCCHCGRCCWGRDSACPLARRVRVRGKRGERAQPRLVAGPDQPMQRPLLAPRLARVDETRIARGRALLIRERDARALPHRGGHCVDERGEVGAAALPAEALVDLAGESTR